jgi:hypothetical protein
MELHGLTNEEIIFIYKINQKSIDTYNLIVEKKGIYDELEIPEMGYISVFKNMSDEDIEVMMESEHYKMCVQIENKLAPVVDMIEETLPEVYEKVENIFKKLSEE